MPIAVLSEDTSRAISSTLVLNDAVSVVKELLDNALDSHATNITIEVSANTLDVIQVKDNGAGIGVEDRQLLCKRNHTSKIRTIEELADLGGSSLGFRGEALASIAELSESVLFTTRVDGESVASSMKFDSKGKLISSSSASHSTGTTVRVSNFLKNIPVRRQTATKDSQRILASIKKLLFDYAFARPTIRFQFKVLKSQSNLKHNWSYIPCKDASNLSLTCSKVVGKDIVAQCAQESIRSDDGALAIEALMVAKDCDASKLVPSAKYISIDGRPVTADHGTMDDVSKKYKSYLRHAISELSNQSKPFLYLRLSCPRGFYDVNIEPAKDQVLFEDSSSVLNLFDQLCRNVYGEPNVSTSSEKKSHRETRKISNDDFDIMLAKKSADGDALEKSKKSNRTENNSTQRQTFEEIVEDRHRSCNEGSLHDTELRNEEQRTVLTSEKEMSSGLPSTTEKTRNLIPEDSTSPSIHNPFILAKLNTRVRPQNLSLVKSKKSKAADCSMPDQDASDIQSTRHDDAQTSTMTPFMPSPSISPECKTPYQNPGPPKRPWTRRQERDGEDDRAQLNSSSARTPETSKTTLVDTWTQITQSSSPPTSQFTPLQVQGMRSSGGVHGKLSGDVRNSEDSTVLRTPTGKAQQSSLLTHKSSDLLSLSEQHGRTVSPSSRTADSSRLLPSPASTNAKHISPAARLPSLRHDPSTELDDIMDFEHRKRCTIQRHRSFGKSSSVHKGFNKKRSEDTQSETYLSASDNDVPEDRILVVNPDHVLRFRSAKEVDDGIPEQPNSASYTQNPHRNRYRKAVRDIEERKLDTAQTTSKTDISSRDNETAGEVLDLKKQPELTKSTAMSPYDPRAFLIRNQDDVSKAVDLSKKQSAARLAKLPFERIPVGQATYMLSASIGSPQSECWTSLDAMKELATKASLVDSYIRSGNTVPALCGRSIPAPATLKAWEATCWRLVEAQISSRFGDAVLEKQIPSDFHINLSATLRKHFEQLED